MDNTDLKREERKQKAAGDPLPVLFFCKQESCRKSGPSVIRKTRGHGTCTICKKYNKL